MERSLLPYYRDIEQLLSLTFARLLRHVVEGHALWKVGDSETANLGDCGYIQRGQFYKVGATPFLQIDS